MIKSLIEYFLFFLALFIVAYTFDDEQKPAVKETVKETFHSVHNLYDEAVEGWTETDSTEVINDTIL